MGEGLKRARKATKATRQPIKGHPDYRLSISFDSAELRELFRGWLSDGGGEQDFMSVVSDERGSRLDIDYDSETLVVVSEHES